MDAVHTSVLHAWLVGGAAIPLHRLEATGLKEPLWAHQIRRDWTPPPQGFVQLIQSVAKK